MRTVTVEDNKIVVEVDGAKVRYSLEIIRKRINTLLQDLEEWRRYERLLTPRAPDEATICPKCNYMAKYPVCLRCGTSIPASQVA